MEGRNLGRFMKNGALHMACSLQKSGLLKVRGELKKSDVVATSLATQSLQQLILEPWVKTWGLACWFYCF